MSTWFRRSGPARWTIAALLPLAVVVAATRLPSDFGQPTPAADSAAQTRPRNQVCAPTETVTLYAERVGDGVGYGLSPSTASVPGPTLEMVEGDCLEVTLVNNTARRVSIHTHGVDYRPRSDGTPLNAGCTQPGESRTYVFGSHAPRERADGTVDAGSAGYWHYHDHCMGGKHGTLGVESGLFGALIVRRAGDPVPDRPPFVVAMVNDTINLRRAPDTPLFEANHGERIEFVVIGHGELFHTFHLHGHRWADTRTGTLPDGQADVAQMDNRTVGPADSFGFQVLAGEGVGPGAWMYHCHVQSHSDSGMSGLLLVRTADGRVSNSARRALQRWSHATHGASRTPADEEQEH